MRAWVALIYMLIMVQVSVNGARDSNGEEEVDLDGEEEVDLDGEEEMDRDLEDKEESEDEELGERSNIIH